MKKKPTSIKVFISKPADKSTSVIEDELAKRNVQFSTIHEFHSGATILSAIESAIKSADLIIALIPEDASHNVFFEIGIAHAYKKQLLIFIPPSFGQLPTDISGLLYVRTDADNREAIGFAIDQCIERLEKPTVRYSKPKYEGKTIGDKADEYLLLLDENGINITEQELVNIVANILKDAGVEAVIESQIHNERIDIAIWSDSLQSLYGNPIIVEIKRFINSESNLLCAVNQVKQYMNVSGANLAIILVNSVSEELALSSIMNDIILITIRDLLERLRIHTFAEVISELRESYSQGKGE